MTEMRVAADQAFVERRCRSTSHWPVYRKFTKRRCRAENVIGAEAGDHCCVVAGMAAAFYEVKDQGDRNSQKQLCQSTL